MSDRGMERLAAALDPLLAALDRLGFVARHMHPPHLDALVAGLEPFEEKLIEARELLGDLPEYLSGVADAMALSGEEALSALGEMREAGERENVRGVFRAMRHYTGALAALYPLAGILPPVNRFFLEPEHRDEAMQKRFMRSGIIENTGVMHFGEGRGGFSIYVPEDYQEDRAYPLVMALHGGSGDGPRFLWSWLTSVRTHGAVLVAPTSVGPTWAIQSEDVDSPNLAKILAFVRAQWSIDQTRMLLTGMSDGGTFSYVSGLDADSPFTHLAPVSAAFHPMFAMSSDAARMRGLPIHITHGVLDWMFPVDMARGAARALERAGAVVTYVELDDLSHTWPREICGRVLGWMGGDQR